MDFSRVELTISGVRPLLMHSAKSVDPLSETSKSLKKVSKIRSKTDEDVRELARLDWYAGFYSDRDGRPVVTADMLTAALIAGAKKIKAGPAAKAGIIVTADALLTNHGHAKGDAATIDDFWGDGASAWVDARGVGVDRKRIIRYRPRFDTWTVRAEIELFDVDADQLRQFATLAGFQCGIGDYRPRFGAFKVDGVKLL